VGTNVSKENAASIVIVKVTLTVSRRWAVGTLQPLPEGWYTPYQSKVSQLKRIIHSKFHMKIAKDKDKHKVMTKVKMTD
jgi:hypothetical protein